MVGQRRQNRYWRLWMNQNLKLAYSINQAADYLNRQADTVLKQEFDISYRQFLIFVGLHYLQPCSQKQVAEFIQLTSAGTLHLLKDLEHSGWIKKEYDAHNKRTVVIEMTAAGSEAFDRMNVLLDNRLNKIISAPHQDITRTIETLNSITQFEN